MSVKNLSEEFEMTAIQYVLAFVLIILCVIIVAVVLMQESRSAGLSGAIAGGADTFFGKGKGKSIEKKLEKSTKILAGIFFALTLGITIFFMFKYNG